jgi:putative serine protease PepD
MAAGGLAIAVVAGTLGGFIATAAHPRTTCDAASIANQVLPSIVTIRLQGTSANGVGTGEILTSDGYIVTNNHVISSAANSGTITVLYSSGESTPATLVGRDPASDLAVLKVSSDRALPTIQLGNSSNVAVGEPVVALGAPLGLSNTVTAGIVSGLDRNVQAPSDNGTTTTLVGSIQTDASINPGNSGGALVDCSGALVGVNTAIATVPNASGDASGGSVGIGFAVPVNFMNTIVAELKSGGGVRTPWFGIEVSLIPVATAQQFGVAPGLFVESVVAGGPAAAAGLREGDIITTIDGKPSTSNDVLTTITQQKSPGDTLTVAYVRSGVPATTTVTLGTPPR